jgi:hypothetical protein
VKRFTVSTAINEDGFETLASCSASSPMNDHGELDNSSATQSRRFGATRGAGAGLGSLGDRGRRSESEPLLRGEL